MFAASETFQGKIKREHLVNEYLQVCPFTSYSQPCVLRSHCCMGSEVKLLSFMFWQYGRHDRT